MNPYYRDYADFLGEIFPFKVQKISINTGNICPNRDGTIGVGGCIYCNNSAFTPGYAAPQLSVAEQIGRGVEFFGRKYPDMRYLAYFQSHTATHSNVAQFVEDLREAASQPGVAGIVIGTRPDCMPDALLERLAEMNRTLPVIVEYGAESAHDSTLRAINRCHTWAQTADAVRRTAAAGIPVGLHLILGLPGETEEMMLASVDALNALEVSTVKFHQLQVVRGTRLERIHREAPVRTFTLDEYIALCVKVVRRLRRDIAIDRFTSQSPDSLLIAPRWGIKNYQFTHILQNALREHC